MIALYKVRFRDLYRGFLSGKTEVIAMHIGPKRKGYDSEEYLKRRFKASQLSTKARLISVVKIVTLRTEKERRKIGAVSKKKDAKKRRRKTRK